MARPSTRAAVRTSAEANARLRVVPTDAASLPGVPIDRPLRAYPEDVRQLVRQEREQVSMEAPMWCYAPREVGT